jgi:hypothetical protein
MDLELLRLLSLSEKKRRLSQRYISITMPVWQGVTDLLQCVERENAPYSKAAV